MNSLNLTPLTRAVKTRVDVPGSKSYTLRALFLAALTPGKVRIEGTLDCDDTDAMVRCLEALGIKVKRSSSYLEVDDSVDAIANKPYELDAGLSGITLRFMLALSCIIAGQQTLRGAPGLNKRPIGDMVDSLRSIGANIQYLGKTGYPPVRVTSAAVYSGTVKISGDVSSQYLSALLMIAPPAGGLNIEVSGTLGSKPYVDMTLDAMRTFGVDVAGKDYSSFKVADQGYKPVAYKVEGDVSSASYFFAIAALTESTITVGNLDPKSAQADMGFLKILERMGSKVSYGTDTITVTGGGVKALEADVADFPDQAQTLAVLAAFAEGKTVISGVKSLRVKETERVKALEQELAKMGIRTSSIKDKLTIRGGQPTAASIATHGDHRMAMSFAVAGTRLAGMSIQDVDVVNKSFPGFWDQLAKLGVAITRTSGTGAKPNIVLIGMRGTGKTTVARELARKLRIMHVDLDEIMAQKLSLSTPEIVQKYGWSYFRDQESAIAKEISGMSGVLISTGGGIVLRPGNVKALRKNGTIVLLRASVDVMADRLQDSSDRPALTGKTTLRAEIKQVLSERQPLYEEAADLIVDTDRLKPAQAADRIIKLLGRAG